MTNQGFVVMKQLMLKTIALVSTTILAGQFIMGCMIFSPIVGKWQDIKTKDIVEFTRSGNFIITTNYGWIVSGTFESIGSNVYRLYYEGWPGTPDTWKCDVSGDTMVVTSGGQTSTYNRVQASNTTTTSKPTIPTMAQAPYYLETVSRVIYAHKVIISDEKVTLEGYWEMVDGNWRFFDTVTINKNITGGLVVQNRKTGEVLLNR